MQHFEPFKTESHQIVNSFPLDRVSEEDMLKYFAVKKSDSGFSLNLSQGWRGNTSRTPAVKFREQKRLRRNDGVLF